MIINIASIIMILLDIIGIKKPMLNESENNVSIIN